MIFHKSYFVLGLVVIHVSGQVGVARMCCLLDDASDAGVCVAQNEHWNKVNCEKVEQCVELLFGRRIPVLVARNDLCSCHGFAIVDGSGGGGGA